MAKNDAEAFHFPERFDPVPELTREVDRLRNEGRHRSALDVILGHLRNEGRSATAFGRALPLLRTARDGPAPDIAEPVTPWQRGNPYFAPIATECARCSTYWYSDHVLADEQENMTVLDPVGQQCPVCRYSLCRNCLTNPRCPEEGCPGELGVPVLPTGRPRGMPANPFTEKVERVAILWRNTPVGQEEVTDLLDLACTWQDCDGITVTSHVSKAGEGERTLERRIGLVEVALNEREGFISPGALDRTRVVPIEAPARGRRLLFVTAAPTTGPASQLSGPIKYLLSDEPAKEAPPPKRRWFRRRG